jgi:predicted dienelactone hydrolase
LQSLYKPKVEFLSVVAVDNITLRDTRRDREIPLRVYYPRAEGSFPIIFFSHGAGGSKEAYSSLSCFWASCGYICIHPTHFGNDSTTLIESGLQAVKKYINDPRVWSVRPQDISFLIDSLEELKYRIPPLKDIMDEARIGISGSSYGAYVTMLLAGAKIDTPWEPDVTFCDHRASAFLAISPQGTGKYGLNPYSWSQIQAPMLMLSGTQDQGWDGEPASWRLEAFKYMPPGDKYQVLIEGAHHASYDENKLRGQALHRIVTRNFQTSDADMADYWKRQKRIRNYVQNASIPFWDAYLKHEDSAKEFLQSDALQVLSGGEISICMK